MQIHSLVGPARWGSRGRSLAPAGLPAVRASAGPLLPTLRHGPGGVARWSGWCSPRLDALQGRKENGYADRAGRLLETIQACTWCGNQGTARVYKVTGEDGTGWACLTCVVLVLADSAQPVSFQGCSAHWLDALRRELVQAPTPDSNATVASVWTRRVGHLVRAIDRARRTTPA
jgi:hypothetical protein